MPGHYCKKYPESEQAKKAREKLSELKQKK